MTTTAVESSAALPDLADATGFTARAGEETLGGFAWWQEDEAPAIVFAHGLGQDATFHADRARAFHARGWHAVCVATRGWPGSTGNPDDYGLHGETDLAGVVGAVREHPCSELWLLGFSAGGLWLTRGLPAVEGITGLVTVNSPMNVRTVYRDTLATRMRRYYDTILTPEHQVACSPVTVADRIHTPMLVFGGTEDGMVPASQGAEISALVPSAGYVEMAGMRHIPTGDEWRHILERMDDWMTHVREQA